MASLTRPADAPALLDQPVDLRGPYLDQGELGRHEETIQSDQEEGGEDPEGGKYQGFQGYSLGRLRKRAPSKGAQVLDVSPRSMRLGKIYHPGWPGKPDPSQVATALRVPLQHFPGFTCGG